MLDESYIQMEDVIIMLAFSVERASIGTAAIDPHDPF